MCRRRSARSHLSALIVGALALWTPSVHAQLCPASSPPDHNIFAGEIPGTSPQTMPRCTANAYYCETPKLVLGPVYELTNPACDPTQPGASCGVRVRMRIEYPGNEDNNQGIYPYIFWWAQAGVPACNPNFIETCTPFAGLCGEPWTATAMYEAFADTSITRGGVNCSNVHDMTDVYSIGAYQCALTPACRKLKKVEDIRVGGPAMADGIGCFGGPPPSRCPDGDCKSCPVPQAGASSSGGPPGFRVPRGEPTENSLYYAARGAGHSGFPGSAQWNVTLGRYWSHDFAERIVPDPDVAHVWLITKYGTFREFTDTNMDGVYETVAPSDELRTLSYLGPGVGWQLESLDGSVQSYDDAGRWTQTLDRNQNATSGCYDSQPACNGPGPLIQVSLPDGKRLDYTYSPTNGRLASITEVGVGGTTSRTWGYEWLGSDLIRVDRPDGTAWSFRYEDRRYPGYMTQRILVGTDDSERVDRAWEYDDMANVVRTWAGDSVADPNGEGVDPGPQAVELWTFDFNTPLLPTQTVVTDPLGGTTTYNLGYDSASSKARVESVSGPCAICDVGPDSSFEYNDSNYPLAPTRMTDGKGVHTDFVYDPVHRTGKPVSKTEAVGTALARVTAWQYNNASFPAFPTRIEMPSTSTGFRRTNIAYDAAGNPTGRTISGQEGGSPFSFTTTTGFNPAGQPTSINPPGYSGNDVTSFTYDATRGNLLPLQRIDPLVGTTVFAYDPFNRRTTVTEPTGLTTESQYDGLDRVTEVRQLGAGSGDLVTTHQYNPFGDLAVTTLPRGNEIRYAYDLAGRLTSIVRRSAGGAQRERTLYELDEAGNRVGEKLQVWNGSSWTTKSETTFDYQNRCQLGTVTSGTGSGTSSVTDYSYDANGNLESVWDPLHPSSGAPSTDYSYDPLNRVATVTQARPGPDPVTTYGYDVQDHLTAVTDAEGNTTTYTYSDRDLLTQQVSPASGTTTYGYNQHGELTFESDARGVSVIRTVDAADRVTFVNYPDNDLDTTYTYGSCAFGQGRLCSIHRGATTISHAYDRFGRMTQDGALTYAYDANGNRTQIDYGAGVTATTTYDFADRPATFDLQQDGRETSLVQAATYLPSGPLTALALGNGVTETRGFDARYFPQAVTAAREATLLDFDYSVDPVGNITGIADGLDPLGDRSFAYQDGSYFLTQADGPWADLSWTYDRIGNRLTQTRDSATDTYNYLPSGSGNSPLLDSIALSGGASADYTWGPAGHLEEVARGANVIDFSWDDAGRLAASTRAAGNAAADFLYDGRSFLAHAEATQGSDDLVEPTYASDGVLAHRSWTGIRPRGPGGTDVELTANDYVLAFADRPLALLSQALPTTATFNDVPETHTFWRYVEQMVLFGVTSGCGGGNYCPTTSVNRAQMATFLLRSADGADYVPPACVAGQEMFADVPATSSSCRWIEEVARRGITSGCGGGNYCPGDPVTRSQMAIFLLRAVEPPGYAPPACTQPPFGDVSAGSPSCPWIQELVARGVTSGCGGGNYCPNATVNRAAMAAFLTRTFDLGLTWLTADHLGTPTLATNRAARATWSGGFEPFGADWLAGTSAGASENGVFVRLPGQWEDPVWTDATLGANLYYNVHRWYEFQTGRYTRVDPLGLRSTTGLMEYGYAEAAPTVNYDPFGLCACNSQCPSGEWTYIGVSLGTAFVGGIGYQRGFFQCQGQPMVTVKTQAICAIIGFALWGGADFTTAGIPGGCGCDTQDLLGEQDFFFFGGGPLSKSFGGRCESGRRSGGLGISASVPLSLGWMRCKVTSR